MYPFLATHLMVKCSQGHNISVILPKKHACALHKNLGEINGSETMVRRREKFLPLTVFILRTFPPAESTGRKKKNSESVGRNIRSGLGHCTNISVQIMHEKRNNLAGYFGNYESISGIPTHRTEIQTAKYDFRRRLFNIPFHLISCIQE
jgi:hypothetical protein